MCDISESCTKIDKVKSFTLEICPRECQQGLYESWLVFFGPELNTRARIQTLGSAESQVLIPKDAEKDAEISAGRDKLLINSSRTCYYSSDSFLCR